MAVDQPLDWPLLILVRQLMTTRLLVALPCRSKLLVHQEVDSYFTLATVEHCFELLKFERPLLAVGQITGRNVVGRAG